MTAVNHFTRLTRVSYGFDSALQMGVYSSNARSDIAMQTFAEHSENWPNALLLREGERSVDVFLEMMGGKVGSLCCTRQFPNRTSAFPPCQFPISAGVPVRLAPSVARVRKKAASDPSPHPVSSRGLDSQGHGADGRWEFGKASEDPLPAPRLAQLGQPAKTTQRTGHRWRG